MASHEESTVQVTAAQPPSWPGARLAWIPHLLTGLRLALSAPILGAAFAGQRALYFSCLVLALATEVDGTVARRLGTASEFGRRFDSWTDIVVQLAALGGLAVLFQDLFRANLGYAITGLLALMLPIVFGLVTRGEPLGYHTFLARGAAMLVGAAVLVFIATDSVALLRASAILEVFVATEYLAIASLRPAWRGTVDGLWRLPAVD